MKYFLQTLMYLCLIFSFLFIIIGLKFSESAVQEASAAGFACYFGILVRVLQAEVNKEKPNTEVNKKECQGNCDNCSCIS
jgi:hypothetical protein